MFSDLFIQGIIGKTQVKSHTKCSSWTPVSGVQGQIRESGEISRTCKDSQGKRSGTLVFDLLEEVWKWGYVEKSCQVPWQEISLSYLSEKFYFQQFPPNAYGSACRSKVAMAMPCGSVHRRIFWCWGATETCFMCTPLQLWFSKIKCTYEIDIPVVSAYVYVHVI